MRICEGIEILDGLPFLYIKKLSAIAGSDLHLGYEGVMADKGIFIPKANLRNIKKMVKKAVEKSNADTMIINGDIKNEFSKVHVEEFNEFHDFAKFIKEELGMKKIILIKGNHDNFIDRLKGPLGFEMHRQEALFEDILFFHGEELPHNKAGKLLVMGHVHPSIGVYNRIGVKEKLRCFLYGSLSDKRKVIILPALNYFASGVDVNLEKDMNGLSPIFDNKLDINKMRTLCIGEGETLDFGEVGDLRYNF